jgi:hypothetical protein
MTTLPTILAAVAVFVGACLAFYSLGRLLGLTLVAVVGAEADAPPPVPPRPLRSGRLSRPAFQPRPETPTPVG